MRRCTLPPKVMVPRLVNEARSCAAHRAWVRKHQCSVPSCLALPIECAHVRSGTDGGTGLKPSDRWAISLCANHHREQHWLGEPRFEAKYSLDLNALATEFFSRSPQRDKLARST